MSDSKSSATYRPQPGGAVLPPVQPPTSGFLLQLFFIPMVIVLIIVVVWMLFSWLAHKGATPRELVKELSRRCMSAVMQLKVPLKVEVGAGKNWADAH